MSFVHHFIHLYFFTEFEILFYIYYILPYEKKLVYDMFSINKMVSKYDDDLVIMLFNNISNINTHNYDKTCDLSQDQLDNDNSKLWNYCFIYIISINILLFLFFIKDLALTYRAFYNSKDIKGTDSNDTDSKGKKITYNSTSSLVSFGSVNHIDLIYKKTDTTSSLSNNNASNNANTNSAFSFEIEPIDLELDIERAGSPLNLNLKCNNMTISNNSFSFYYWNNSDFLLASSRTIQLIILIGIFEYLFFIVIVNKYKIVNAKLLLCKMIQEL
jgi:hypothetical protein